MYPLVTVYEPAWRGDGAVQESVATKGSRDKGGYLIGKYGIRYDLHRSVDASIEGQMITACDQKVVHKPF